MEENKKDITLEDMMEQQEPQLILPGEEEPQAASSSVPEDDMVEEFVHVEPAAPELKPELQLEPEPEPAAPELEPELQAEPESEPEVPELEPELQAEPELEMEPQPEETGFFAGGIAQLTEVKTAIENLNQCEQEYKDTEKYLKGKSKELEIQKKRVEEKIQSTIKKSRADLEKGYNDDITTCEKAIKDAETRKKTAKAAAVNERMKRENSTLVDDNKVLGAEIKSRFKEASVPSLCRSSLYYSLFSPKKLTDYLICLAAILIFAGLIPFGVTSFIEGPVLKILVWVLVVVFFAAIYFLIAFWTKKGERNDAIQDMRSKVKQIKDNKKAIKNRNKNIKADPDESQYNLYEYDQQLESARNDLDQAKLAREKAIENFEQVESVKIREELEQEKAPVFEQLEKEITQMQEDFRTREEAYHEAARVMEEYQNTFGDKGLKAEKIDELIAILQEGKASNIREALNVQKNK